ncbi:thiamine pyrophosphate-dependent enzyme [Micromonospora sp. BRA006-A]|nr:thiamine pyrophosphate-dependent enzyme [Micromonospora sp. BRA006-A]
MAALCELLPPTDRAAPSPRPQPAPPEPADPPSADALFAALADAWPADGVLVQESPSTHAPRRRLPIERPRSYLTMASGGLGFGLPAAVGMALAERDTGRGRPVVAVVGDGSFHYSVQALWTAARPRLPLAVVVPVNQQYAILKAFAELKHTLRARAGPARVGRDGGGARLRLRRCGDHAGRLGAALTTALDADRPTVLPVPISTDVPRIL